MVKGYNMDSLLSSSSTSSSVQQYSAVSLQINTAKAQVNYLAIQSLSASSSEDAASISFEDLYQGLPLTAQKIIDQINGKIGVENYIQNHVSDDNSPEATADRIVSGVTGLFGVYSEQHPELEGEDLLSGFMETIRKGVQTGYDDAYSFLQGLGAFDYDGVQSGVEQTKALIETKLNDFETKMREQLGLNTEVNADSVSNQVSNELLAQSGYNVLNITA